MQGCITPTMTYDNCFSWFWISPEFEQQRANEANIITSHI